MNYFITGGTGFIGTHLASLLHEVYPEAKNLQLGYYRAGHSITDSKKL